MYCAAVTKLPGPGEYQRSLSRVCPLAQPVTRVPSAAALPPCRAAPRQTELMSR